jgi:hypothetical protein
MLVIAAVSLLVNLFGVALLRRGQSESLNVRGAYLEVFADMLGSVAVLAAAGLIKATGWSGWDPVASIAIGAMILPRTSMLLREAVNVLLESTPRGMDLSFVRRHLREADGVADVHDLHAWAITSGLPILTAHVVVEPPGLGRRAHPRHPRHAPGLPAGPLRRRALHVPAGAGRIPRARGDLPLRTTASGVNPPVWKSRMESGIGAEFGSVIRERPATLVRHTCGALAQLAE